MDSNVEKVKDKLSITDVIGQYITLKRAGRTYIARCPFHNEKTPSFHVSPERGTYKCFGCGEGGDIFTFVEKMEGIDFGAALRQLADKAGVKLEKQFIQSPEHKEHEERLREVCEEATKFFESKLVERNDVREYLRSRGLHEDTTAVWRLGYAPAAWEELSKHLLARGFTKDEMVDAGFAVKSEKKPGEIFDRFRGRIIFPIFDAMSRPIGVSGRYFEKVPGQKEESEPAKYVNSPETVLFKKSKTLYGFDRARNAIRKADCILLVEGQFDLVLSHQSGLPFAVALSGTALTPEHLSLLGRLSKRLVLALDADAAGLRSGLKSAQMALQAGFDVKVPTFPAGQDPADVARENPELLKAAIRTSRTAIEFFMDALRPGAKDERGFAKTVETYVLPLIAAMESKIQQEHFIRIVAQKLGVSEAAVRAEVGRKPAAAPDAPQLAAQQTSETFTASPLETKIGMLLFSFPPDSAVRANVVALAGEERIKDIEAKLATHAEALRFRFDGELGEHISEETVVKDMLRDIERILMKELMMQARGAGDLKQMEEIARRAQGLGA
ncbi:MAG TPA: DNA primase [Candidatus Paceibacterota bacterium]|nr:DNA primase [Candidatus Paceibacterota bacterium]